MSIKLDHLEFDFLMTVKLYLAMHHMHFILHFIFRDKKDYRRLEEYTDFHEIYNIKHTNLSYYSLGHHVRRWCTL